METTRNELNKNLAQMTTVLRRMFHVLILNGECRHTMTDKTGGRVGEVRVHKL